MAALADLCEQRCSTLKTLIDHSLTELIVITVICGDVIIIVTILLFLFLLLLIMFFGSTRKSKWIIHSEVKKAAQVELTRMSRSIASLQSVRSQIRQ